MSVLGIGMAKVSVCLLVLRVVDKAAIKFSRFLWAMIAFVAVLHLTEALMILFSCIPIEALWDSNIEGKCNAVGIRFTFLYVENGE